MSDQYRGLNRLAATQRPQERAGSPDELPTQPVARVTRDDGLAGWWQSLSDPRVRPDGAWGERPRRQPPLIPWLPRDQRLRILSLIACACLLIGALAAIPFSRHYGAQYDRDQLLVTQGTAHLRNAENLLKGIAQNPLDSASVVQARGEFAPAYADFTQVERELNAQPGAIALVPHYGPLYRAAKHLVPLAAALAQAGMIGCDALTLVQSRLRDPLNATGSGITQDDLSMLSREATELQTLVDAARAQVQQVQPGDLAQQPGLNKEFATLTAALPQLVDGMRSVQSLITAAPLFLGIGTPANYLIEQLDSTELRPGGGFIGTYGIATVSGARLSKIEMTDVDLLDRPFEFAGHTIAFPPQYSWFTLVKSWSLRDSNLDADFATSARSAEQLYATEGGTVPLQGVIAITPYLIEHAFSITGPIYVPEYHETVTAENLIDRIHYHQLKAQEGPDYTPSPDGHSSLRKRFTNYLFAHFLDRVKQLGATALPQFARLFLDSLRTKDLQIYFNANAAETVLQRYHLGASIAAPAGDSLFVVDANIAGSKSNDFITYTLSDQVSLDASGTALHHTTLTYVWPVSAESQQNDYGSKTLYRDYVRVYSPPGSTLRGQSGWSAQGMSTAFDRTVWAGTFSLPYGHSGTITLDWSAPHAASHDASGWHYRYLIQRQAGVYWHLDLALTLPTCAALVGTPTGLTRHDQRYADAHETITTDLNFSADYTCAGH